MRSSFRRGKHPRPARFHFPPQRNLFSIPELAEADKGGSFYGASAVVGSRGGNPPTETDLAIAKALGKRVAPVASKLRG
ncbi:MAG TPA: hypothetical protein ENF16_01885 [Bacteroidetes bacterium]|nr:hypothetical protein [Bacteroidota bacterium]